MEELERKGYKVEKEHRVKDILGGFKSARYGDIIVTSPEGEEWIIQVGKHTKTGLPVAREIKAIQDLERAGYRVEFVPYN